MRRYRAVQLFLLLTLLLGAACPDALATWRCADGSPCESRSALVCCCGSEPSRAVAGDCCDTAADGEGFQSFARSCGCYVDDAALAARLNACHFPDEPVASPAEVRLVALDRDHSAAPFPRPTDWVGPPRYLISPRDTRAPPTL